jgi:hypothetical protein
MLYPTVIVESLELTFLHGKHTVEFFTRNCLEKLVYILVTIWPP